jgi:hypothetical protein
MKKVLFLALLIIAGTVLKVNAQDVILKQDSSEIGNTQVSETSTSPAGAPEKTTWHIEGETLYLSGKGKVPATAFGQQSPWYQHRSQFNAVVIEEGVTEIGKFAFNGFKNITSLTIARSVRNLDGNSFSLCSNLATVEVKSATPPNVHINAFFSSKIKKAKLIVPNGCSAKYKDTPVWEKFGSVEESGQSAVDADELNRTLEASCTVHLYREARFSGGAATLRVYLNGVEQEGLDNGQTVEMKTDRLKNEIVIKWRKSNLGRLYFDAVSGGVMKINYSAATANFKIME